MSLPFEHIIHHMQIQITAVNRNYMHGKVHATAYANYITAAMYKLTKDS